MNQECNFEYNRRSFGQRFTKVNCYTDSLFGKPERNEELIIRKNVITIKLTFPFTLINKVFKVLQH